MRTTVTAPIAHLCPHVAEVDHGTITLVFEGAAPELHGVRRLLDSYAGVEVTHEALTDEIARRYPHAKVTTSWTTAGLAVECEG